MSGDSAYLRAVEEKVINAACSEKHAGGEGLKADLDVVPDVERKHHEIVVGLAHAQARIGRIVHFVKAGDSGRIDEVIDEIGKRRQHQQQHQQGTGKKHGGCRNEAPLGAHQARKAARQKIHQRSRAGAARPIEQVMATQGDPVQTVDEVGLYWRSRASASSWQMCRYARGISWSAITPEGATLRLPRCWSLWSSHCSKASHSLAWRCSKMTCFTACPLGNSRCPQDATRPVRGAHPRSATAQSRPAPRSVRP